MVERLNRTREQFLSKLVERPQTDWDKRLHPFLLAYRAAIHDTTGEAPARILYLKKKPELPCDLEFGPTKNVTAGTHGDKFKTADDSAKACYNSGANHGSLMKEILVWLYNLRCREGLSPKLSPSWEGPSRVMKRINDEIYRIQIKDEGGTLKSFKRGSRIS